MCAASTVVPRIRYTRKSTEEDDKQIASHEQQTAVMDAKWGRTNTGVHFQDNYTGTTFDRPGFTSLLQFCTEHRRDKMPEKGLIEVYDMSRFGRILTGGEEDPEEMLGMMKRLLNLGWEVRFSTFESTGNRTMDFFQNGLYAIMAAEVSKKLKRDVRRGRNHFLTLETGARWMGGRAPFGTRRVDPETGRILSRRERALNRGGTLLVVDEEEMALWVEAANLLLRGHSYQHIVDLWNKRGVRSDVGKEWTPKEIKLILTNRALVGELHVNHRDVKTNEIQKKVYKAAWGKLVDEALFEAVSAEVRRRLDADIRAPYQRRSGPFSPYCAHCGCPYYYQERKRPETARGVDRFFVHPNPKSGISGDWKERIEAAGCRSWSLSAPVIENSLRDLIVEKRATSEFALHLSEIMADRGDLEVSAQGQRERAEAKLKEIEALQKQTVRNMTAAQARGLPDDIFWEQLADLNKQIALAKEAKREALELEHAANAAWDDIQELIEETKNIQSIWESGTVERRHEILHWWVRSLMVVVDKQPVLKSGASDPKTLVAFLRIAPTEALDVSLARAQKSDTTGTRSPLLLGFVLPMALRYTGNAFWVPADDPNLGQLLYDLAPPSYRSTVLGTLVGKVS